MAKTLKDLLVALLNATLILLAFCLFLGWKLAQTVQNIQAGIAENLHVVAPLRDQAESIREELVGLRNDLSNLSIQGGPIDSITRQRLNAALHRLTNIEATLENTQARMSNLAEHPEELINYAITTSAEVVTDKIQSVRGCEPAT